ncbi:MAG: 3-oxoacyl-ACP reductase FabG [Candidatus Dasytiphilus stammeri]
MSLKGKIALVTGANRGIGRAIAEKLSAQGAQVAGTATQLAGAEAISTKLIRSGGKGYVLELTNPNSIQNILGKIRLELGDIDILINNAGITCNYLIIHMKESEWQRVITTNLSSIFRLSQAVMRSMIKKKFGRIINIGSIIGETGQVGQTCYAATKSGLSGFTKSLAQEVAAKGITVNVVAPGFIETDMTSRLKEEIRSKILQKIPVGRFGSTQDIANAVAFLVSEDAAYITGQTLHINGGMYMA